ncbi:helix-turn-helix domain-containing protein [Mesorhizobium sp. M0601]|uniref:helix-turn-helix domain-containing protein n=1 Tax=Mesorhizobium sp. M0601 TaxID=2956969 RepID=UPI003334E4BB
MARELGIFRKGLYHWQKQFRAGGPAALRGRVGPPRAVRRVGEAHDPGGAAPALPSKALDEPSKASARIGQLERLVGYPVQSVTHLSTCPLRAAERAHGRSAVAPSSRR